MAATITASMAGELARKIVAPISKPNKDIDDKFKALKENMDSLTERLDPESVEFKLERDLLIKQFKESVGFDEFPISDQKKMVESINVQTGANYDALVSIQGNLNNSSSLLYKNLARQIGSIISTPLKAITFSKSVIEQLSETIKNKVANIAPIRAIGASFANLKSYIGGSLTNIKSSVSGFLSNIKSGIASFGSKLASFNPMGKIVEFVKKLFQPIIDAIKMVGKIIMDVLRFIMQVVIIAFQLLFSIISFLFTLTISLVSLLFALTTTIVTLLFALATTVITLLFSLATAIITGLIAIIGVIVGFIVSIALAALTLMASIFIFALVTLTTVFLTIFAMFAFLIFTVMELLLVASLMGLLAIATVFAIVMFLIPIMMAMLITTFVAVALLMLTTALLLLIVVPTLLLVIFFSIATYLIAGLILAMALFIIIPMLIGLILIGVATLVMTGILLFTMLFFIAPMIFGIMAYLLAVITPMLAFITLLCLISAIAGILIIAIVLVVAYLLYKAWQWATAFYEKHIKPWVDMVVGWFNKIWDWAVAFYKDYIQPWIDEFKRIWNTYLQPVIDWITKTLMAVIGWIWDIFKSGWDFVSGIISSIWEFISNPGKMIAGVASKVGSVVSESFSAVTDKLSSWGSSVVDAVNPMNWFAEGRIALEPMKAVFAEKGPEAAIPLDDRGLEFLRKTFNLDDNSFNIALNNSDLYRCVLDIKDQNIQIKEILDEVEYKMSNMEKPSFFESVTQSYTNMFSPPDVAGGATHKKEQPAETILKKLMEIEQLIKTAPQGESTPSQVQDSEMSIAKMIATGLLGRR